MQKEAQVEKTVKKVALVTYSLTNLSHSDKTRFGYALKGRSGKGGMLKLVNGEHVGRNNILFPLEKLPEIKDFLSTWKIQYKVRRFIELK
ncbi:MAG: hypothetical protein MAG795_00073 [Candidatus Woesearchaeota archaeon]|nr:hypothetical protein [Candidatus Woesearchaeota archaeon]